MVLEFFRQIPNCSGVHRRSSPGYRGSFSPPVSNDTDSRSSLSERTVKRVASRYLERARKSGDFSFLAVAFFCNFCSRRREKQKLRRFFAMGMKLTILGSGTSQGVPVIGCRCAVCTSKDPRDNRLRTSAMLEWDDIRLVIDAGSRFPLPDAPDRGPAYRRDSADARTQRPYRRIGRRAGLQFRRLSHDPSDRRIRNTADAQMRPQGLRLCLQCGQVIGGCPKSSCAK